MAKVGSSSIVAALAEARLPVFHVHRMNADHLRSLREQRRALGWADVPIPAHDRLGLRLRRRVIDRGARVKIITLVRDPIARNISSYFEHVDAIWHTENAHESIALESLVEGFHTRFPQSEPLTWFDDEMRSTTGIDVYEVPFSPSGHVVLTHQNLDLLILKSELSDDAKAAALSELVGLDSLTIRPANRTEDKAKGATYRAFRAALRFDHSYLEQMLDSRYARHFYTPSEREAMWRKYAA